MIDALMANLEKARANGIGSRLGLTKKGLCT